MRRAFIALISLFLASNCCASVVSIDADGFANGTPYADINAPKAWDIATDDFENTEKKG